MSDNEKLERISPMHGAWILGYAQGMSMALQTTTGGRKSKCDEIGTKMAKSYLECPERAEDLGKKLTVLAKFAANWADGGRA